MVRQAWWLLVPVLLVIGLIAVERTHGSPQKKVVAATVQDNAGLFSKDAKDKANSEIFSIKARFDKDLLIETFNSSPAGIEKIDAKEKDARRKFFFDFARERAKTSKVNGVYVLIVEDAKNKVKQLIPVAGDKTRKNGWFTNDNLKVLDEKMRAKLRDKKPDEALLSGVNYVSETFTKQAPKTAQSTDKKAAAAKPKTSTGFPPWLGYVCIGLVVLLVIWLVIGLFRAFSGAGSAGAAGAGGGGSGGGGFLPGLMGGLFGAMAGMWMYNQFFGGGMSSAYGAPPSSTDPGGQTPESDVGGDYGGDAGGDYGGDDWGGGGGDAGGDWGGGDDW